MSNHGNEPKDLLSELLRGAQENLADERSALQQRISERAKQQRAAQNQREARRRDEMQRRLIEETRRRNAALRRPEPPRESVNDTSTVEQVAIAANVMPPAAVDPPRLTPRAGVPAWLMAALVLVAVGLGVGGAFALAPGQTIAVPDVALIAETTIRQTMVAAAAEQEASMALQSANDRLDRLQRQLRASRAEQARLGTEFEAARAALAQTRTQLETLRADASQRARKGWQQRARQRRLERQRDTLDIDLDSYETKPHR